MITLLKVTKLAVLGSLGVVVAAALIVGEIGASDPAAAAGRHRRHDRMRGADAPRRPVIPYERSFYPEEIDGGVSGNLSFNNQIRKFKDPLNANGGGG